ncbi:conjugal transfer protein TraF [Enterobacter hormaechei]|uniref:conjugal transfer protein TraF n=1 Tax=Enterobacter hormaechei TaxID=158836 RepID=UPI001256BBEE|nr:conjugal transfer protein TraF [Enterobacter hormaechei]ECC3269521.1 conjugal transfer protein TraF [Salmonella enterica subsp. enterica]EDK1561901.1 conjugal transfer protein TraF [Salmonella enterica subsp. enterica serovar Newport]EHD0299422.1 conjugal transfer protein TraF [Salmonella enterica subsp. enterica serovar Enteritidis]EIY8279318.1 conjugal transfer protein TraF [Salmonella enterica]VAK79322.1 TraF precursor [Enterobacter cloacae]
MCKPLLALSLLCLGLNATASTGAETVTKNPKHGLFWYETPKKEEEKQAENKYPRPSVPSAEELFNMHPKDIQALLDKTRDYAVYKLSPDAVLDYYKVQDASRRKAAAFTNLTGYVMLDNPSLNAAQDYPITNPGNAEKQRERQDAKTKSLQKNRDEYALLFFTEPNCGFCVQQSRILENFQRESGWYIKQVDIAREPAARKTFNVDRAPVTILIKKNAPTGKWMPVSVGVDSLDNLRTSIYNMTRVLNGELDPRQFFTNEKQQGGFFDPLKGTSK